MFFHPHIYGKHKYLYKTLLPFTCQIQNQFDTFQFCIPAGLIVEAASLSTGSAFSVDFNFPVEPFLREISTLYVMNNKPNDSITFKIHVTSLTILNYQQTVHFQVKHLRPRMDMKYFKNRKFSPQLHAT